MRSLVIVVALAALAGCSTQGVVHHSPYDLDRDGTMDARCPGLEYDTSKNTLYGWRSKGSEACEEQSS
ncbi:hypothetical protein EY643_03930 [Halioglobus maricola]|uniref:Lipoprotein n=1 Tax=Halioglobus maricola TaxID=2601894 RepID=A0A5P9NH43_9GAMM|nr:hypothetical protein [Halioglobus maricola]QFU74855.1 hypothetical protein EY643_03930 [Halioglobus maricola]